MICVGIDVAKNKHDINIIDYSTGEVILDHITIKNNLEGYTSILDLIEVYPQDQVIMGCESTGHYSNNIRAFFLERNFQFHLLNAYDVKTFRDFHNGRKMKTDKIDCKMITELLYYSRDKLVINNMDDDISELRCLTRNRNKLRNKLTADKIELHCLIDNVFPEFHDFFKSGIHIASSYALLSEYQLPHQICKTRIDKLTNILRESSKGRFGKAEALKLKDLAKRSIGKRSEALAFSISQIVNSIRFIQDQIKKVEQKIDTYLEKINSPITTIPGIGNILGAIIISEIGDIQRFDSAKKLVAYAGLNPSVYQSGNFNSNNNHITKQGNRYLRSAVWKAANLIWLHNETFQQYYTLKKNQGKHHSVIIGHITKKLLTVVHKLLSSNESYITV